MIIITTQCFPPKLGGIENLMGGLAQSLAAQGKTVKVYADSSKEPARFTDFSVERFGGFKPLRRLRKAWTVALASKAEGVEGIFADSWKSIEHLGRASVPVSVLAHGMEFPASPSPAKARRIRTALARANSVIASSSYTASLASPYLDPARTRLVVINPPIGPQPTAPEEELAVLRQITADRGPVIATLSRLEPRKGIDSVLDALPALLARHPSLIYLVAGGGDDRPRLEALARERGVEHAVRFLGPLDAGRKAALYSVADVFAMPTRREGNSVEGFGIVYLEAAWYGLPALATRDGGAVDAVREGETGLLCLPRDIDDVAEKIDRLINDARGPRRLAEAARKRAHGEAQWTARVQEYLATLRQNHS
jgi:phosphatidylinositol alpha-1,6-mannosyltransferase